MSSELAIRVEGVGKCYQVYEKPHDRLKHFILPHFRSLLRQPAKAYCRDFWALQGVSFEVRKGETVGIVGRNGSGKSTLLQLICGTLAPTSGSVFTNGRIAALLELGSGFNPEFTGRENVYLNAAILGLSAAETGSRFESIVDFAEIGDFIDQPVKVYSSGMMLRLAFAVQASLEPDILIVDEALAVGDERFQRKCFARLEELKKNGAAILFVSHAGSQIVELCDSALLLEQGELLAQASPADVVRSYQRFIYASAEEQARLRVSFRSGQLLQCAGMQGGRALDLMDELALPADDFDPTLRPSTTVVYPENGARIEGFEIRDEAGRSVNLLEAGKDYSFIVRGEFLSPLEGVHFGIHIRAVSGTVISGQRFPPDGEALDGLEPGRRFEIAFRFNLALLPETYFFGGGIWAREPMCAHRILDAGMFRVRSSAPRKAFGFCDLSVGDAHLELS